MEGASETWESVSLPESEPEPTELNERALCEREYLGCPVAPVAAYGLCGEYCGTAEPALPCSCRMTWSTMLPEDFCWS